MIEAQLARGNGSETGADIGCGSQAVKKRGQVQLQGGQGTGKCVTAWRTPRSGVWLMICQLRNGPVMIAEDSRYKLQSGSQRACSDNFRLDFHLLTRRFEPQKEPLSYRWRIMGMNEHSSVTHIDALLFNEATTIGIINETAKLPPLEFPFFQHKYFPPCIG